MTPAQVTAWSATPGLLSEGPRWHGERQELLWVDIVGRQLHRATVGADGAMQRLRTITLDAISAQPHRQSAAATYSPQGNGFCSSTKQVSSTSSRSQTGADRRAHERRSL
jgi:sugar lactone lactonase YvrE